MKMTMVLVFLMVPVSAFDFGLGRERGHRVDDDQVDRARAHQGVDDLERLFAGVGLADQQLLQVDAELLRVLDVERVFGVDEGAGTAELLHFGHDLQGQRGLARGLGAVDLDHPTARQAANAERDVQAQRAGGDDLDVFDHFAIGQAHDRALAELLFDLCQCGLQGLGLFAVERAVGAGAGFAGCVHGVLRWFAAIIAKAGCLYSACEIENFASYNPTKRSPTNRVRPTTRRQACAS
jgi:hypothetical protein